MWHEKWGESYDGAGGWVCGRAGGRRWERWSERPVGIGWSCFHAPPPPPAAAACLFAGGCVKYTDKWAEREHFGGAREQWGDKWEENFKDGRGNKQV